MHASLEVRLLAHGIDATTMSAGRARKRNRSYGPALTLAVALIALALLALAI
jgi:hypothetical protein